MPINRMSLIAVSLCGISLFTSCKTQEQIRREQMVDDMNMQMVEGQKLRADQAVRLQQIEERLGIVTGKIEETGHESKQQIESSLTTVQSRIQVLEEANKAYQETIDKNNEKLVVIEKKLKEQDEYLKKLLKTLEKATGKTPKKKLSRYDQAMSSYRKRNYSKAKLQLEALLDDKKIKGSKRARVLHNLGMVSYIQNRDEDAMAYFGKLFTQYPKSTYNANGLIHLAKSFKRQGQNDQAKQTLNEMIARFPKHKRVPQAKKLLKTL